MRSLTRRISVATMEISLACPPAPPEGSASWVISAMESEEDSGERTMDHDGGVGEGDAVASFACEEIFSCG